VRNDSFACLVFCINNYATVTSQTRFEKLKELSDRFYERISLPLPLHPFAMRLGSTWAINNNRGAKFVRFSDPIHPQTADEKLHARFTVRLRRQTD